MRMALEISRNVVFDGAFDGTTSLPGAMPERLPSRKICVSTACAGCPHHMFRTTLAVFRPTPGKTLQGGAGFGTSPSYSSTRIRDSFITFLALLRKRPIDLDMLDQGFLAQCQHLFRRVGQFEQVARRRFTPCIGGLRRKCHGHHKRVGVDMLQLALSVPVQRPKSRENLAH